MESNKEQENYIKTLEETTGIEAYKGKAVSEAGKKKVRTLKCFLSRVEMAALISKNWALA